MNLWNKPETAPIECLAQRRRVRRERQEEECFIASIRIIRLLPALPKDQDRDRLQDQLGVPPGREVLVVINVQEHRLFKIHLAPAVDLPDARAAGPCGVPQFLPILIRIPLIDEAGPGTDEAHVTLEDVVQLRQFVQAVFP